MTEKICLSCGETKAFSEFHKHPATKDGCQSQCKKCKTAYAREWQKANSEKYKNNQQEWRRANSEKQKEACRKWHKANSEKHKKLSREWRKLNPERVQEYRKINSEKILACARKRKALKKGADGSHTEKDIDKIFRNQGGVCNTCGKKLTYYRKKRYHVDHIIPLAKGGSNWPDNLQLLCPACNQSKGTKNPVEWARQSGRLF